MSQNISSNNCKYNDSIKDDHIFFFHFINNNIHLNQRKMYTFNINRDYSFK